MNISLRRKGNTTMTTLDKEKLLNALKLAKKSKVTVKRAVNKKTGDLVFYSLSRSQSKKLGYPVYHLISVIDTVIHCPCEHGRVSGNVCVHEAAVYKNLYPSQFLQEFICYRGV